jgi:hypothetical protein
MWGAGFYFNILTSEERVRHFTHRRRAIRKLRAPVRLVELVHGSYRFSAVRERGAAVVSFFGCRLEPGYPLVKTIDSDQRMVARAQHA